MYFNEEFAKLRICLFRCVFCRNPPCEQSLFYLLFCERTGVQSICIVRKGSACRVVGIYQNVLFSSSFYTTVVSDGLHEPYLLLTNSLFILILSDSHRGCLIWVKFVAIPKQKFENQLNVIYLYFIL